MDISKINRERLQDIIFQCEQALYNHQQWFNLILRSLVCNLPPDRHDIAKDAYKECRFGQWYYAIASEYLKKHPGFIALGDEHKKMHEAASKLLIATANSQTVSPYDYDDFSNALERMRLELTALQRELSELLYNRDALTGAINRINMLSILREQQNLVKRGMQRCSIAMLDLDDFKDVNDKHGHIVGDAVLARIARYLLENIRSYDKLFRYGGEEFLLCFQNLDTAETLKKVEQLRQGISELAIRIDGSEVVKMTVSIGVSTLEPDLSIEESIEQADSALYTAKHEGKNCTRQWQKPA